MNREEPPELKITSNLNYKLPSDLTKPSPTLLVILGPTASGKTRLAVRVARALNGEIVSADSRQVYRGMDIGTGKDLKEYELDDRTVPFHLVDIIEAGEKYNVHRFQHDFGETVAELYAREKVPVVCGGTGLYIESVLRGYNYTGIPVNLELRKDLEVLSTDALHVRFSKIRSSFEDIADTSTRKRLIRAIEIGEFLEENPDADQDLSSSASFSYLCFGLNPEVETRRQRISKRLTERLENGLIDEVQQLLERGISADQLIYYGLEYKYVTQFLTGLMTRDEMKRKLETEIRRFAKRQMTYFRKMEKDGIGINWLDPEMGLDEMVAEIAVKYKTLMK